MEQLEADFGTMGCDEIMTGAREIWRTRRHVLRSGVLLAAALLVVACSDRAEDPAGAAPGTGEPPRVKVAVVRAEPVRSRVEVLGTLQARLKVDVATELGGSVERLYFDRGDRVSSGQVLAEIGTTSLALEVRQAEAAVAVAASEMEKVETGSRPEEIRIAEAALTQARARLRESERHFDRIRDLYEKKAVSDSDYDAADRSLDAARADVSSARESLALAEKGPRAEDRRTARARREQAGAALALARDRLRKSRVRTPCDGIASFRRVEVGEVVSPGTVLTRVADTSGMKIRASVAEHDLPLLENGGLYRFSVDAVNGADFSCRLVFVSPTGDPATRSFPVELLVEDHDPRMADGMTARVVFPLLHPQKRIRVPSAWLAEENGLIGLLAVEKGRLRFQPVTLGDYYERFVEIVSGLEGGESVVTTPAGLRSGDRVQVEPSP